MEINVNPLEDWKKIENEICEFEGCDCNPEIEVSIFKRKRENDDYIGANISLYFCKKHFINFKDQFLNKYDRLFKYYRILDQKEKEIAYLKLKMSSGLELEESEKSE